MKLVRFSRHNDEVLINPEKVLYVEKEVVPEYHIKTLAGKTIVNILFSGVSEKLCFIGKDAEKIWDYFSKDIN